MLHSYLSLQTKIPKPTPKLILSLFSICLAQPRYLSLSFSAKPSSPNCTPTFWPGPRSLLFFFLPLSFSFHPCRPTPAQVSLSLFPSLLSRSSQLATRPDPPLTDLLFFRQIVAAASNPSPLFLDNYSFLFLNLSLYYDPFQHFLYFALFHTKWLPN